MTKAILMLFLSQCILSTHATEFDPQLKSMLNSNSTKAVRVVAFFNDQQKISPESATKLSRLQKEAELIKNSNLSQRTVLTLLKSSIGSESATIRQKSIWLVNALVIELPQNQLKILNHKDIKKVSADFSVHLLTPVHKKSVTSPKDEGYTYGLTKIQVPELKSANPSLTGKNVRIGVLDTGIDGKHPDLEGRVVAFKDFVNGKTEAYDDNGHGTHCSGTIGGRDHSGTFIGIAPEVKFIGAKFLNSGGGGTFSAALEAMQYLADPDGNPSTNDAPMAVSNSWGAQMNYSGKNPEDEPLCQAVEAWVKLGILPIFAAGNSGPSAKTIGLPGACPQVLTIGATDSADAAASFSSRGPAVWKSVSLVKPDVSAPGVKILSSIPGGKYAEFSGTSMATPHVAGLSALLYQKSPNLNVKDMIELIKKTTDKVGQDPNTFGTGRINALKAEKVLN